MAELTDHRQCRQRIPTLEHRSRATTSTRSSSSASRFWPVRIADENEDRIKIHYIGWPKSYDEWRVREDVKEISNIRDNALCKQLSVQIKEHLNSKSLQNDSKISLKIPVIDTEEFQNLQRSGKIYKVTPHKVVYNIKHRHDLEKILGVGWDYRVISENGDNFFVKTETVKFWIYKRKPLKEFILYPGHQEESLIDRGICLTFTFVVCSGNRGKLPFLQNADVL
ncbi:uncharacterized protein LOC117344989 [Pecten maximus]|uniref:uncharacterized protein LOC117344989 n=1 Tax=Pecten maximus TaxID=6579 RepID=UPI0014587752|nr:uncharacterized protein LOC117344989 [Pecten maximus]XP_033763791.1 uncharacterized protein LOC117344989 [Pecten maximus]XP_033763792.1 uncharacterized protein LOC117344989 [Pecten maximus]